MAIVSLDEKQMRTSHIESSIPISLTASGVEVGIENSATTDVQDAASNLRLAKDGHTILIPQPNEDLHNPVNWSSFKKHILLFTVGICAFIADFSSSAGIPCVVVQAEEWHMTPNGVNYAGNLNVLMLAIGSIFWLPFIHFWGRAPTLFWTAVLGCGFNIGAAVAPNFVTFYATRALTGFSTTACVAVGLTFIKDMFFFHEHARKIGIWAAMFLLAPYLGALLGNFIVGRSGQWRPVFWMCFAINALALVLIILFADESFYNAAVPLEQQPLRGRRIWRLVGVWQIQHHQYFTSVKASYLRPWKVLVKPIVPLIMIYYALFFMWSIGINITSSLLFETPRSQGGYGLGPIGVGCTYVAPIIGVIIGEGFGHFFNDFLVRRHVHRHEGHFQPEVRLWACYVGAAFMIPGLILVGQALRWRLSLAAIVVGWGMYIFGVMVSSVAITAYALDSYPNASGELSTLINVARTGSGFATGYFQEPWGNSQGFDVSFGIQAATVVVAVLIVIILHRYGRSLRTKGGILDL